MHLASSFDQRLPDLVVFDLEATGTTPEEHDILEIGAVRVSPDLVTIRGEFEAKTQPTRLATADPAALKISGYSPADWSTARPLADVLREFAAFADGALLTGYNVAFDWGFLRTAFQRLGLSLNVDYHVFDVMSLVVARTLSAGQPASIRLGATLTRLGLPLQPEPHRALEDARATLALLKFLQQRDEKR